MRFLNELEFLRGTSTQGDIVVSVVTESCEQDDIDGLFRSICTKFLIDKDWNTRCNAAKLLGSLGRKHNAHLVSMLSTGANVILII